jgi:hypothetical protein
MLPAPSVAMAQKVVVLSSPTDTAIPGDAKFAALPEPAADRQLESVKRFTAEPASDAPLIKGELSLAGERGEVEVNVGAEGAVESST